MMSEKQIEKSIIEFIRFLPPDRITVWKNDTTGIYDAKRKAWRANPGRVRGVSDILGVVRQKMGEREVGIFLALEVKRSSSSRVSPMQTKFLERITALGGVGGIVTSIEDTITILKENFDGFEELST
jgi:hypothetical protein